MKIDVEGAEIEVIQGGYDLLTRNRPYLWIECHEGGFCVLKEQVRDVLDITFGPRYILEVNEYIKNAPHIFGRPFSGMLPHCWICNAVLCLDAQKHFFDKTEEL